MHVLSPASVALATFMLSSLPGFQGARGIHDKPVTRGPSSAASPTLPDSLDLPGLPGTGTGTKAQTALPNFSQTVRVLYDHPQQL